MILVLTISDCRISGGLAQLWTDLNLPDTGYSPAMSKR
jgi:hypothetical protein